jgi:hypothetical protein
MEKLRFSELKLVPKDARAGSFGSAYTSTMHSFMYVKNLQ